MSSTINTNLLLVLASTVINEDAARFNTNVVGSGDSFAIKLAEESKKRIDEDETKAAGQILDTIKIKNAIVLANVQRVAVLKKQIADIEQCSADLAKAEKYGFETRNFLPLALLSGQPAPQGADKALLSFPKDWTPTEVNTDVPASAATSTPAA